MELSLQIKVCTDVEAWTEIQIPSHSNAIYAYFIEIWTIRDQRLWEKNVWSQY